MVWLFSSVVRVGCVMLLNVCGSAIVYLLSDAASSMRFPNATRRDLYRPHDLIL